MGSTDEDFSKARGAPPLFGRYVFLERRALCEHGFEVFRISEHVPHVDSLRSVFVRISGFGARIFYRGTL